VGLRSREDNAGIRSPRRIQRDKKDDNDIDKTDWHVAPPEAKPARPWTGFLSRAVPSTMCFWAGGVKAAPKPIIGGYAANAGRAGINR